MSPLDPVLAAGPKLSVSIGRRDLYRATAIPAAITCESLVKDSGTPPGFGYLGELTSQDQRFLSKLREDGFWNQKYCTGLAERGLRCRYSVLADRTRSPGDVDCHAKSVFFGA